MGAVETTETAWGNREIAFGHFALHKYHHGGVETEIIEAIRDRSRGRGIYWARFIIRGIRY